MADITFRDRKYGRSLDSSFGLWDGDSLSDAGSYHVGDTVAVCFPDQHEKQAALNEHRPSGSDHYLGHDDGFLHVRCVVVRRSHSVVWRSVGRLERLGGTTVVLEAADGFWEDVLKWIMLDEKPAWVPMP